jgi:starch phosphorylase
MLREYVESIYMPAANGLRHRTADAARVAKEINAWRSAIQKHWANLHFGELDIRMHDSQWECQVPVYFGELDPSLVSVELYADPLDGGYPVHIPMVRGERIPGALNGYIYRCQTLATRPAEHFTPRVIPTHLAASVPLEEAHILWQR